MSFAPENQTLAKPEALLRVPVGLASPLWGLFAGAAVSGAAWWWMTRWARPQNLEALYATAVEVETAAEPEMAALMAPAATVVETVPPVMEAVAEEVVEPVLEAVAETALEPVAEVAVEVASEPVAEPIVEAMIAAPILAEAPMVAEAALDVTAEAAPVAPKAKKKAAANVVSPNAD